MPIIQSRKYRNDDHNQFVSADTWALLKKKGLDRRYRIVDDDDIHETVIQAPESITNFSQPIESTIEEVREMSRDDLKVWLTENEIEFNVRASTDKLYELYLSNQ